jgi:hypothetical protein
MNKLLLTTAMVGAFALTSTAAIAEHHEGGNYKGKMMERVDTDGDGQVSKAEFMAKHEEMFTKMDTNSDGFVSPEEMKAAKEMKKEKWKEKKEKYKEMKDGQAE